jgi:hypothetical protein
MGGRYWDLTSGFRRVKADQIKTLIANVRKGLDVVLANAPQLPKSERWADLVRYIIDKIVVVKRWETRSSLNLMLLLSG